MRQKCVKLTLSIIQAKIGTWNTLDRLDMSREIKDDQNMGQEHPMANKTFVITAVLVSIIVIS